MVRWSQKNNLAAHAEGWNIFYLDDGNFAIQRLDDPEGVAADFDQEPYTGPHFPHDEAAIGYVKERAAQGNQLAIKALQFIKEHPPHHKPNLCRCATCG